jgi:hypothetical protein
MHESVEFESVELIAGDNVFKSIVAGGDQPNLKEIEKGEAYIFEYTTVTSFHFGCVGANMPIKVISKFH